MSGGEGFLVSPSLCCAHATARCRPGGTDVRGVVAGGLSMASQVPREMVLVLQGLVVLVLGGAAPLLTRLTSSRGGARG